MADDKLTALTADGTPVGADLLYIVDDVAGTPTSKKVTVTNLAASTAFSSVYQSLVDTLWLPTDLWGASTGGTPVVGNIGDDIPVWLLDQTTVETVGTTVLLPSHWVTWTGQIVWTNAGAGSGNVVLQVAYRSGWGDGESIGPNVAGSNQTVAAPTSLTSKFTTGVTGVAVPSAGEFLSLRVRRVANDGGDTLGNDIGILGMRLTKAS